MEDTSHRKKVKLLKNFFNHFFLDFTLDWKRQWKVVISWLIVFTFCITNVIKYILNAGNHI